MLKFFVILHLLLLQLLASVLSYRDIYHDDSLVEVCLSNEDDDTIILELLPETRNCFFNQVYICSFEYISYIYIHTCDEFD